MHKIVPGFVVAALISVGLSGSVSAQDTAATPVIPAAAECTVAPISFERLSSTSSASPVAGVPVAQASPQANPTVPAGEPADDETSTAVKATVTQLIACLNAGDTLRILAIYSDRFIAAGFAGAEITQAMYDVEAASATPSAAGEEVVLINIGDVVMQPDGRAALVVVGDDKRSPDGAKGTLFYLVEADGQWLVDETVEDSDPAS